ncbi:MAG TPA: hypothetical protein VFH01_02390 [Pyrinomonadaceae bacterium]|nr:hypothetical protein [Pyrinomonadaceae bacterium]
MQQDQLDRTFKTVQVLSIVAGVVFSVLSFNQARKQEAEAQQSEAEKQKLEAAKPFLELRQRLYLDAVKQAAILATQEVHSKDEIETARKRFRELYVAELSMVEGANVEAAMIKLADEVDPELRNLTPAQKAAYELSHVLRNSLVTSWKVDEKIVDNPR